MNRRTLIGLSVFALGAAGLAVPAWAAQDGRTAQAPAYPYYYPQAPYYGGYGPYGAQPPGYPGLPGPPALRPAQPSAVRPATAPVVPVGPAATTRPPADAAPPPAAPVEAAEPTAGSAGAPGGVAIGPGAPVSALESPSVRPAVPSEPPAELPAGPGIVPAAAAGAVPATAASPVANASAAEAGADFVLQPLSVAPAGRMLLDSGDLGAVAAVFRTERGRIGPVLASAGGRTLYTSGRDPAGRSLCQEDACMRLWRPFLVGRSDTPAAPFGAVGRPDGSRQWSLAGKPLYLWAGDRNAGDVTGDGVDGTWFAVRVTAGD